LSESRVGLVGCGHISVAHLRAWRSIQGYRLAAVFDLDRSLAERRAQEFGADVVTDSVEEVVESCEVVDVCTPPQTHAEIAEKVVGAGRHLLIEKPVVIRVEDWERVRGLAERSGSKISVIHNLKFASSVLTAGRWLAEGRIGRLVRVECRFLTSPETDRMLVAEGHWSHALPGGRWFETLPHHLYLIHHLAGPMEVEEVTAVARPSQSGRSIAPEAVVTFRRDRCLGILQYSAECRLNVRSLLLVGSKGSVEIDLPSDAAVLSRSSEAGRKKLKRAAGLPFLRALPALGRAVPDRLGYLTRRLRGDTPHGRQIRQFAAYLNGAADSPTPVEEIDYVVRNCEAIGRLIDRQAALAAEAGPEAAAETPATSTDS